MESGKYVYFTYQKNETSLMEQSSARLSSELTLGINGQPLCTGRIIV
jgi:hypothetical protein